MSPSKLGSGAGGFNNSLADSLNKNNNNNGGGGPEGHQRLTPLPSMSSGMMQGDMLSMAATSSCRMGAKGGPPPNVKLESPLSVGSSCPLTPTSATCNSILYRKIINMYVKNWFLGFFLCCMYNVVQSIITCSLGCWL